MKHINPWVGEGTSVYSLYVTGIQNNPQAQEPSANVEIVSVCISLKHITRRQSILHLSNIYCIAKTNICVWIQTWN